MLTHEPPSQAKTQHALGWLQWGMSRPAAASNLGKPSGIQSRRSKRRRDHLSQRLRIRSVQHRQDGAFRVNCGAWRCWRNRGPPPRHVLGKLANLEEETSATPVSLRPRHRARIRSATSSTRGPSHRSLRTLAMERWEEAEWWKSSQRGNVSGDARGHGDRYPRRLA